MTLIEQPTQFYSRAVSRVLGGDAGCGGSPLDPPGEGMSESDGDEADGEMIELDQPVQLPHWQVAIVHLG